MSGALKQKQQVHTNTTKGSVCKVDVPPVKFAQLWDNYVTGDPYDDPSKTHPNQCAIRLSATLHGVGIEMKSFSQNTVKPAPGKETLGRILLNGKPAATRAVEMAAWIRLQPFCGLPTKPEHITGKDWESKIKGRTGIVAFANYWRHDEEPASNVSGGHIDLWNGSRLTNNGFNSTLTNFARFSLGMSSGPGFSDLAKSTEILFWEIK